MPRAEPVIRPVSGQRNDRVNAHDGGVQHGNRSRGQLVLLHEMDVQHTEGRKPRHGYGRESGVRPKGLWKPAPRRCGGGRRPCCRWWRRCLVVQRMRHLCAQPHQQAQGCRTGNGTVSSVSAQPLMVRAQNLPVCLPTGRTLAAVPKKQLRRPRRPPRPEGRTAVPAGIVRDCGTTRPLGSPLKPLWIPGGVRRGGAPDPASWSCSCGAPSLWPGLPALRR